MLHAQVYAGLDYSGKIIGLFGELDNLLYNTKVTHAQPVTSFHDWHRMFNRLIGKL